MPEIPIDLPGYIFVFSIAILMPVVTLSGICTTRECVLNYLLILFIIWVLLTAIFCILARVFGWEPYMISRHRW